ncbi:hypothetical protein HYX08_06715 [Candidatus Woesearchaeota archaeon]|nr:hypothetical protein [Candidatus Woesearchaeota archaeon]
MNKEKYLGVVASFLIVLVLTIPFYTTVVYAAISSVSIRGGDGIEGFAKANDFLNVNVQASIAGDSITNNQVVLGSSTQFDKCVPSANNGSECTLRFPGNGTESFDPKSAAFTVNLFKDDSSLDDSKSGSITIDNKAPQVKLSSQPKFSSQQNVVIEYDVTDLSCDDPSCSGKCVGLKNIELYTKDGAFKQAIDPATSSCNAKSSISIDSKIFNDGKNSVFAKATDKFNQVSSETSATFDVDSTGPSIIAGSFEILRKGISISTFSSAGINVDVAVNISGNSLDLNSVRADLSELNPSQNLKNVKASCSIDSVSRCKWSIELNPGTGGLKTIAINASDVSGNKESAAITKFLSIDETGPVVLSLSTGTEQNVAKASGNTVIAEFEEATGLVPEDVFLNVGSSKIKATSCGKEANWFCIWNNVNFAGAASVSVDHESLDILGIDAAGDISLDVIVDAQLPVLKSINITNVGGLAQAFPGFAKIGDKISVVANMTEENDLSATADFSKFISGASNVAGQCERIQADEHICTWLTESINLQASDVITFNFSDDAGNTLILTRSFKTFGVENATVPDFWSNTVDCSPATIDRELGPLLNQRVFCQVSLRQKSGTKAVSTIFIGPAACSGDSSIIQSVDTLKTEVGSSSPVIKVTLKKDDFKINNASLSCSFNIFSKIGSSTTVTKNPEIENVKISLAFSNLPLGELSEEVKGKIKEAKEDAEGIWEIIGVMNKIVFYAKKICSLFGTLYNIISILFSVALLLGYSKEACENLPYIGWICRGALQPTATATCVTESSVRDTTQEGLIGYGQKFCRFVNCQWNPEFIEKYWSGPVKNTLNNLPLTKYISKDITQYMDPKSNLIVATAFACLPGIIYGLDKYRQIKCLYADCLQNAVGKEGLPVTACEDQKTYATCKYITGEIFAIIPYTAFIDHFMGLVKNALSNPFSALGAGISALCWSFCKFELPGATALYQGCEFVKLFSTMGVVLGEIKGIIDQGFQIREDYCSRLDDEEDDKKDDKKDEELTKTSGAKT